MKKLQVFVFAIALCIGFKQNLSAQQHMLLEILETSATSPEYYEISDNTPGTGMKGTKGFFIRKIIRASKKETFKVEMEIPDNTTMRYPRSNFASFTLIGENIIVVYDVNQKSTKNCFIRFVNTQTGSLSENTLAFSDEVKSKFNFHEIVFKTFYSPDFGKMAVLKDNISPDNNNDAELNIYEIKPLRLASHKNLGQKYNGSKRVFDLTSTIMDNNGNIQLVFNLMNEQTKMTTKSYTAKLPLNANELQDIKEVNANAVANGSSQTSQGRFYKSLKDYINDNSIPGIRIKNGSYSYSIVRGSDFKLIDDNGNLKKEDAKNLPSDLFTYKPQDDVDPFLIRIIDKKPYIVLAAGKLSYYALYSDNQIRYYTEGWEDADLKSFKESKLEDYLEKFGLLEEYKKTMPKRKIDDNVNGWFNKNLDHQIEFFNKLNKKMN